MKRPLDVSSVWHSNLLQVSGYFDTALKFPQYLFVGGPGVGGNEI